MKNISPTCATPTKVPYSGALSVDNSTTTISLAAKAVKAVSKVIGIITSSAVAAGISKVKVPKETPLF